MTRIKKLIMVLHAFIMVEVLVLFVMFYASGPLLASYPVWSVVLAAWVFLGYVFYKSCKAFPLTRMELVDVIVVLSLLVTAYQHIFPQSYIDSIAKYTILTACPEYVGDEETGPCEAISVINKDRDRRYKNVKSGYSNYGDFIFPQTASVMNFGHKIDSNYNWLSGYSLIGKFVSPIITGPIMLLEAAIKILVYDSPLICLLMLLDSFLNEATKRKIYRRLFGWDITSG